MTLRSTVNYNTARNLKVGEHKLTVTQVKSLIGANPKHRETVRSLGLKRIGHTVVREADAVTVGMLNSVKHLVQAEEAN
ncbi:50S ribosomal protein L30 [Nesterenkonia sp. E16_7]|uniref:50S ribosomal protein L30 n=1 Tax=unclassified Nesterenkonia TaxID=2629769 RepID=UPI001A92CFA5|nr:MULTISPECIES: 50S ribosomal protein L30 [unclassified Nesterenkonia]MBO0594164.1 50S ribosomal protein L30 [Nesterenkonia sp. E16_10]MBO0597610.1 50S ribosomal protein L30 [Nesterenkonia sp. E16_7]